MATHGVLGCHDNEAGDVMSEDGAVGGVSPTGSLGHRRHSDDLGNHHNHGLTQVHLTVWAGAPPPRRQSVATVQTDDPRPTRSQQQRRRSEFTAHQKRRRSRADGFNMEGGYGREKTGGGGTGGRRGTRGSVAGSGQVGCEEEQDPEEATRSRAVLVCAAVAAIILITAVTLIAVTLKMSPTIDEMGEC